jgi:hypothetical protein
LVVLVALFALSGCPLADECGSDADCANEEHVCELDPNDATIGLCLLPNECQRDADCAAHDAVRYVCSGDGECRLPCMSDADCPGAGWKCDVSPSSLSACVPS